MKLNLSQYENRKIQITTKDDKVYIGIAIDFTPADENTPEIDSICIGNIEFYANEIKKVQLLWLTLILR